MAVWILHVNPAVIRPDRKNTHQRANSGRLAHKSTVNYDIVMRGQVVRPAVMRPLPLHSGRNLPLGHEAPPTVLWEEPGGGHFAQERDIIKEYTKTQIIAMF